MQKTGILYICPTPIGNLEDITLRAIKILKEVDLIACEDTRITQKLLNHYEIKTKTTSYHKFSEKEKSEYLIELLQKGLNIALVSDAGTPLISDPGLELVKQAYLNNIRVIPLPGASAVITTISASNLKTPHFAFFGFFPESQKEKESILLGYKSLNLVFYESPNRLVKVLKEIKQIVGDKNAIVARELTKIYEEIKNDLISNLIEHYTKSPPKGEIVLIVEASLKEKNSVEKSQLINKIKILEKEGYSTKEISKILSLLTDIPKKHIYNLSIELKKD